MQKFIFLLFLCLLVSCQKLIPESDVKTVQEKARSLTEAYGLAVADGKKSNRFVIDFDRLFAGASSTISYYTGQYGDPMWTSKAGIYERYILSMQFKIQLDQTRTKIIESDEPKFHLIEVESVSAGPNGTHIIRYGAREERFDAVAWEKLVKSNGDFSTLGITLEKSKPVARFSEAIKTD